MTPTSVRRAAPLHLPRLGVGALTWGSTGRRGSEGPDEERRAFEASVAAGATLIDTAEVYGWGLSERRVGELARGRDALIATKFLPLPGRSAGSVERALAASLSRLATDSVDLYQVHFPVPWIPIRGLMDRMADAVEAGRVRAVGVSNFSPRQTRLAHAALARRGVPLASNQVNHSLILRRAEADGLLDTCRELGVTLIAYCPLAQGVLTGKHSPDARRAGPRRHLPPFRRRDGEALAPLLARLRAIAERHGRTPAQVALRWLIEQGGVLPIPGARSGRQAADNAGALSFALDREEWDELDAATRRWRR